MRDPSAFPLLANETSDHRGNRGCTQAHADTATDLIGAAEALLTVPYRAQGFFLAHAAVEEIAKIPMLVGVALDIIAGRTVDWKEVGKRS
jgi:AbiV family abortive infection protein